MYPGHHAQTIPVKPAYVMAASGETVTYAALEAASNRVAHLWRSLGLVAGCGWHVERRARAGDHRRAFVEERTGDAEAHALAPPGHDDDLPVELAHSLLPPSAATKDDN